MSTVETHSLSIALRLVSYTPYGNRVQRIVFLTFGEGTLAV